MKILRITIDGDVVGRMNGKENSLSTHVHIIQGKTMKLFTFLTFVLFMASYVRAQDVDVSSKSATIRIGDIDISVKKAPFMQGDWELSMVGSVGSMTSKSSYTSAVYSSTGESSTQYVFLSATAGYYLADRISIEPELSLIATGDEKPAQSILLNLSYTYPLANTNIAIFIRGGYGLGNGTTILLESGIPLRQTDGLDINTINAGAGAKFLIAQGAALRLEVNYRQQTYSHDGGSGSYSYSIENKNSVIRCCLGFSVLL